MKAENKTIHTFPLSVAQEAIWLHQNLNPHSNSYNIPVLFKVENSAGYEAIKDTIKQVVKKYDIIRTRFKEVEGKPYQIVSDYIEDFSLETLIETDRNFNKSIKEFVRKPFDIENGTLYRFLFIRARKDDHFVLMVFHHLITDGTSLYLLAKEIREICQNTEIRYNIVNEPSYQYSNYVNWESEQLNSNESNVHKNYWLEKLSGERTSLTLPYDFPLNRKHKQSASKKITIDADLLRNLEEVARKTNSSTYNVMFAGFVILLHRLTGEHDIIVGSPVINRETKESLKAQGLFLNTVMLRNEVKPEQSIADFLKETKRTMMQALRHKSYPFGKIIKDLQLKNDPDRFPITSVFFNGLTFFDDVLKEEAFESFQDGFGLDINFDIDCYITYTKEKLMVRLDYREALFKEDTIDLLLAKYHHILEQICSKFDQPISSINYKTIDTKRIILGDTSWFNPNATILDIFTQQAEKYPKNVAVISDEKVLTYQQLNEITNQWAKLLKRQNSESKIVICVAHNYNMAVSVLSVLKTGRCYIPMDVSYPKNRKMLLLEDASSSVVIADNSTIASFEGIKNMNVINLDSNLYLFESKDNLIFNTVPDSYAYIMYTSGSTGKPKGVIQSHRNVLHFISQYSSALNIHSADLLTGFSPITYDSFNNDFYGALLNGATYCPLAIRDHFDEEQIESWIQKHKITIWHSVPGIFRLLANAWIKKNIKFDSLRIVKMTGEAVRNSDFKNFRKITNEHARFAVSLGSTESTLSTINLFTHQSVVEKPVMPVGFPVDRSSIKIFNANHNELDVLEPGEIVVESYFITPGYFKNPELNKATFKNSGEDRCYYTGDIGRKLPDGRIEWLNRKDSQVKIHGVRIEPGEIESHALFFRGIKETVVTVRENTGKQIKQLCLYYVAEEKIDPLIIKNYLASRLPSFSIPNYYIQLNEFPYTSTGKLNYKALPEPVIKEEKQYVKPTNEIDNKLVEIWAEVLEIDKNKISIYDNFFESGGHSLKVLQLIHKIHKELGRKLDLKELFNNPTIALQAKLLETKNKEAFEHITLLPQQEFYELSHSQKRLWVLSQLSDASLAYHISTAVSLSGSYNHNLIQRIFNSLIERHETLRTCFVEINGIPFQKVLTFDTIDFKIEYQDVSHHSDPSTKIQQILNSKNNEPFKLGEAPLLRVTVIKKEENVHVLHLNMHHIISDGWSMEVMVKEIVRLYESFSESNINPLKPLKIQYKDYAAWQSKLLQSSNFKIHKQYWLQQFEDDIPVLDLPVDRPRPKAQTFNGSMVRFELPPELTKKIKDFSNRNDATLFMTLLSLVKTLLYRYTGQSDIITGTAIAGRDHADLENQIGFFVNTLPLRTRFNGEDTFLQLVQKVKQTTLGAFEHRMFTFDYLVDHLNIERDISRNPLFDVMVILQNTGTASQNIPSLNGLDIKLLQQEHNVSKFDFTFNFAEKNNSLFIELEYNSDLYDKSRAERLTEHFANIASIVIDNPGYTVNDFDYLSENERKQIVLDFNNTDLYYPKNKTLIELFEKQVKKTPQEIAIVYDTKELTYAQLNAYANAIASVLRKKGVKPNQYVGVYLDRSLEMFAAIVGILKSGGAYLPLDTSIPDDRLAYMLTDSNTKIVLTDKKDIYEKLSSLSSVDLISIDLNQITPDVTNPSKVNNAEDLAYIIYTSGSTGRPKGVMLSHRAVHNYIAGMCDKIPFSQSRPIVSVTSISFDIFVTESLLPLTKGIKIILADEKAINDASTLSRIIVEKGAKMMQTTPSRYNLLLTESFSKALANLEFIITGGEALTESLLNKLRENSKGAIINVYGPTETTVWSTCTEIGRNDKISIGKPIANTQIYILDKNLLAVPVGIAGDLYIGGDGLAHGYLNQKDLTGEMFIKSPFATSAIIYKTGDLARWLPDGNIEYLGRADSQVKLKGFRIELGEIESCINKYAGVKESAVIVRDVTDEKYLCAYYAAENAIDEKNLREYLKNVLPYYMIPAHFMHLAVLPKTTSGKLNRKALPVPEFTQLSRYVAPRNEEENKLIEIYADVLDINKEEISLTASFFELGGHSLKASRLIHRIHQVFGKKLELKEIFTHTTIEEQYKLLNEKGIVLQTIINPVPVQEYYELSGSQKRIWILSQLDGGSIAYNMPFTFRLKGEINLEAFKKSADSIIARHESLRTIFVEIDYEPKQKILPQTDMLNVFQFIDLIESTHTTHEIHSLLEKEAKTPFNLSRGPLLKITLIRLSNDLHILMLNMHHIISDGWSMDVILKDFIITYDAFVKGETPSLKLLPIQYKDYAAWYNEQYTTDRLNTDREYWKKQFDGEIPVLDFPTDRTRPKVQTYNGNLIHFEINKALTQKIKDFCHKEDVTLFMGLLGFVKALLFRYTDQNDIVAGVPVAGREHAGLEEQVGFYVNTLALRTTFKENSSFKQLLSCVKETTLGAFQHQAYGFNKLVEDLNISRDLSRSPLFDIMVVLQNTDLNTVNIPELKNLEISKYEASHVVSKFDITFYFIEQNGKIRCEIEYNTDLFDESRFTRLQGHLLTIIEKLIENPDVQVNELDILTPLERKELFSFNNTLVYYPKDKTVIDLFEESVKKYPHNTALAYLGETLTYKEFHKKTTCMASVLQSKGIKPGDIVAIIAERSIEMIIAIYGVMKAGGAYLPIDPNYPAERIKYILNDSKAEQIITSSPEISNKITAYTHLRNIIELESFQYKEINETVRSNNKPNDLAYVIYTSGSTGTPKGVMIEHHSLTNITYCLQKLYPLQEKDAFLFKTTFTFDVSVAELFGWFWNGGKLVVLAKDGEKDREAIVEIIQKERITHINFVPSMFSLFLEGLENNLDAIASLKYILLAGEALQPNLAKRFKDLKTNIALENIYGPTEGTIYACGYSLQQWTPDTPVFIGKGLDNIQLFVANKKNKLQPKGIPGELIIAGEGVAKGYLNNKELSNAKFIRILFGESNGKVYKTGDLVKWSEDGNIDYLGRIDNQVKIRGFRIELGEIEKCLEKYSGITEAVVTVIGENSEDKRLIAYYKSPETISKKEIQNHLAEMLPAYMVPDTYIYIEEFPKTSSGKIDKKRLPLPEFDSGKNYIAPQNKEQEELVAIWSDILGVKTGEISINISFFELGGHSLKASRLIYKIHQVFNKKLELKEIFSHTTIEEQSTLIQSKGIDQHQVIQPIPLQEYYDLSGSQKRLWILSQMEGGSVAYNMPTTFEIKGHIELNAFEKAIENLVARHESLRTIFIEIDGEPKQKIIPQTDLPSILHFVDLTGKEAAQKEAEILIEKEIQIPFNLSQGPLIKATLIKLADKHHILLINQHHIISDGWSMDIILKDFLIMYGAFVQRETPALKPLPIQYKDYAAWYNELYAKGKLNEQKEYWKKQFEGEIPLLDFPTDRPRPKIQTYNGSEIHFELNRTLSQKIKDFCTKEDVTLFMALLGFVKALLFRYTGQNDIVVGVPVAGRDHAGLEDQVGFYVNTLALRTSFEEDSSFTQLLNKIKETTLEAYQHQIYGFDKLIEDLNLARDFSRSPLFDIMVVLQNTDINKNNTSLSNIEVKRYTSTHVVSKFDITFNFIEIDGKIRCELEYNTDLFNKQRFERLQDHLVNIIEKSIENPAIQVNEIDILTTNERQQLLHTFNNTATEYPRDKTVIDLFEEAVKKYPNNTALTHQEQALTYKEFHRKVNCLAAVLQDKGIKPNDIVAIIADRSFEMVIAIYGVMKAGGVYLPIDPGYPAERIKYILDDSKAKQIITTTEEISNKLIAHTRLRNIIDLEVFDYSQGITNPASPGTPEDLAYVIYTSGSTGNPKGVMIEHHSLTNVIWSLQKRYPLMENDAFLFKTTYTFDVSVAELFGWFLNGGKLAILAKGGEKDKDAIIETIKKEKVTHINFVPSMFSVFIDGLETKQDALSSLKYILLAGEALPPNLVSRFKELRTNIILENIYGPTEATVYACAYSLEQWTPDQPVFIGKALDNVQLFVLNQRNQIQPQGVPGELFISGEGVARGYLNNPELTHARFINNAFGTGFAYKTGDLVRLSEDDNIEYLGRIDNQVKIRGYRIELGEIEKCLEKIEGIKEAVVNVTGDSAENKKLVAYYISTKTISKEKFQYYLSEKLPSYMVPDTYVGLPAFPKTSSGKIDRKKLPSPEFESGKSYIAPRNNIEKELVEIWSSVLGIKKEAISIDRNLFELGGNSLSALKIISRIQSSLKVELTLTTVLKNSTISSLSDAINNLGNKARFIQNITETVNEATDTQKMYYYFHQKAKTSAFHIPSALEVNGELDIERLKKAFDSLIGRHELLKSYYIEKDNTLLQITPNHVDYKIDHVNSSEKDIQKEFDEIFDPPFDLAKSPLFRIKIISLNLHRHVLAMDISHVITDGMSQFILLNDLIRLYQGEKLETPKITYKDYSYWLKNRSIEDHKSFWKKELLNPFIPLNLPVDNKNVAGNKKGHKDKSVSWLIEEDDTDLIRKISVQQNISCYNAFLAIYNIFLSKICNQNDIHVITMVSHRKFKDTEEIVGPFINRIPIRNYVDSQIKFSDFLIQSTNRTLSVLEHSEYGYINIYNRTKYNEDLIQPIFNVKFAYENFGNTDLEFDGLTIKPFGYIQKTLTFDFGLTIAEKPDHFEATFDYQNLLFEHSTVNQLASYFKEISKLMLKHSEIKIADIHNFKKQ